MYFLYEKNFLKHQDLIEFSNEAILLHCKTSFLQGMNGAQKQTSAAKSQIL